MSQNGLQPFEHFRDPGDTTTPGEAIPLPESGFDGVAASVLDLLSGYAHLLVAAFLVTLIATPIVRRIAIRFDVIDHPDEKRKVHRVPIAYLGGVAVFAGLLVAIVMSYIFTDDVTRQYLSVPLAVVVGMVAITFTGLADDIWGFDPRLKIAGQLVAAAALAIEDVGVRVAEGILTPIMGLPEEALFSDAFLPMLLNEHIYYWVGTALIAVFVLGSCNATNLIDGLDGLLSGVVAIIAVGLLAICLLTPDPLMLGDEAGPNDLYGPRIVLCLALLGAVLGFLPHNMNPATIFLGDCGSLLLGYMCAVIILMLGNEGKTHLVFAGLIVFSVPIMDTALAILRRLLAGTSLSAADDQHLHHQMKRALGGVKRAVFSLYGISAVFALLGVSLAALVTKTDLRVRVIYAIALMLFSFIGVIAVKAARRTQYELASKQIASRAAAKRKATRPAAPRETPPVDADAGERGAVAKSGEVRT